MASFQGNLRNAGKCKAGIVGIPFDDHSSYLKGAALAPEAIREAFCNPSANRATESRLDLDKNSEWKDLGDIEVRDYKSDITQGIAELLQRNIIPVSLGGDHSITYPIIEAFSKKYRELTIIQLDAHGDLYDQFEGNKYSHACPFARIMEAGLASRLIQVGIRTMTPHQSQQASRFNVEVVEMKDFNGKLDLAVKGPLYLSLDMDVLDPGYAPGISHYEPGGMSPREVIAIIQNLEAKLVGADIVELNPSRDRFNITAMAAAKFMKEIMAKMLG